jgi:hypothetical protein
MKTVDRLRTAAPPRLGPAGANGGICTFLAAQQTLNGIITVDSISVWTSSLRMGPYSPDRSIRPEPQAR